MVRVNKNSSQDLAKYINNIPKKAASKRSTDLHFYNYHSKNSSLHSSIATMKEKRNVIAGVTDLTINDIDMKNIKRAEHLP